MERCPSWPKEHDWKSCRRQKRLEGSNPSLSARYYLLLRPVGQAVKTPPFHGGNRGSIPLRVIIWRLSSAGRASALQAEGRGFEPLSLHHFHYIEFPNIIAGWSSSVARRAHNPKVTGSNPVPAINFPKEILLELWCRGLTCLPVTQEIAGSNPVSSAIFTKLYYPVGSH